MTVGTFLWDWIVPYIGLGRAMPAPTVMCWHQFAEEHTVDELSIDEHTINEHIIGEHAIRGRGGHCPSQSDR
ncbi:MAG: hypothetical protein FWD97_08535 [Defluviitaleaceae bacterium]|nr:hypothetical protein [Defluviitaleaceae bacterium]